MGEYEPNDSRNVTGTAASEDGRWTGQAANDPTMTDQQRQMQQQGGQGQQDQGQGQQGQNQQAFTQEEAAQAGKQGQQWQQQDDADDVVQFEPAPELEQRIGQQQAGQSGQQSAPQQNMGGSQGSIGQANDGVASAASQSNDHTSAIGRNQGPEGSQQSGDPYAGQAQQFENTAGQQGGPSGQTRFADQIAKHQEVVDAQGNHLGTVDHVDGDRIKLTRQDSPDGEHHYVSLSEVEGIEGGRVRLSGSGNLDG